MWGQMQIRPNFQKFSQKVKQSRCDESKQSSFHNKKTKLSCAEVFSACLSLSKAAVGCYILLYVGRCVAECGAYTSSKAFHARVYWIRPSSVTRGWGGRRSPLPPRKFFASPGKMCWT